jgi:exodeoxyribonuclease V beta subunit
MLLNDESFLRLTEGELFKEKALRYKNNLRYLDLLVKNGDGSYTVIDYKSAMNFSDKHLKQVRYYVNAVREITDAKVSGYICYILEDEIRVVQV